ncbi:hypothetical protein [Aeromonas jandaei]|uniref:hypothetical protein n=1 Tax=Aeromonas jandaei TaxID=650 RepID=UPI0038D0462D
MKRLAFGMGELKGEGAANHPPDHQITAGKRGKGSWPQGQQGWGLPPIDWLAEKGCKARPARAG